jgi:hypothetical protein
VGAADASRFVYDWQLTQYDDEWAPVAGAMVNLLSEVLASVAYWVSRC